MAIAGSGRGADTVVLLTPSYTKSILDTKVHKDVYKRQDMGVTVEEINMRRAALHEFNPMMGHRGCRLAVTYPEIAKMQTRAVMEAAIEVKQEKGYDIVPEIMIPLVGEKKELAYVKEVVVQTAEKVKAYYESDIKYKVGTMIEIPRAALLADRCV